MSLFATALTAQGTWQEVASFNVEGTSIYGGGAQFGRDAFSDGGQILLKAGTGGVYSVPVIEYEAGRWRRSGSLSAAPSAFQNFGLSTAISNEWAVVSAETSAGELFLCIYRRTNGAWSLFDEVLEPPSSSLTFAYGMELDGTTLLVGDYSFSPGAGSGAIYSYEFDGSAWVLTQTVTPDNAIAGMRFGRYLSLEGDRFVATSPGNGAGSIFVFERQGGVWVQTADLPRPMSFHGGPVDLTGDQFIVGLPGDPFLPRNGEAYVYELSNGAWTETAYLPDPELDPGSYYGLSVAIDGARAVVAGPYADDVVTREGRAFVFASDGNSWSLDQTLVGSTTSAYLGEGLALNGNQMVITEYVFGRVLVYDFTAAATVRNGSGVNPTCYTALAPLVGQTWMATVDVSGHPGASLSLVAGFVMPLAGVQTKFGELLGGGGTVFSSTAIPAAGSSVHTELIPDDPSLTGLTAYSQAAIFGGLGIELCNATDLSVGF